MLSSHDREKKWKLFKGQCREKGRERKEAVLLGEFYRERLNERSSWTQVKAE